MMWLTLCKVSSVSESLLWLTGLKAPTNQLTNRFFLCTAIELIKELMSYEVADSLLSGLVALLRPALDDIKPRQDLLAGKILIAASVK